MEEMRKRRFIKLIPHRVAQLTRRWEPLLRIVEVAALVYLCAILSR